MKNEIQNLEEPDSKQILQYEPMVKLFKKLTKRMNILENLDTETVQLIFKYAQTENPQPFFYTAEEIRQILEPIIEIIKKYFPENEVEEILQDDGFLEPEEIEKLVAKILGKIKKEYADVAKNWQIQRSTNPRQKGFKIRSQEYKIVTPAVARDAKEIPGTLYHELLIHVLRRIKREKNGYSPEHDYITFEEGLANAVEQFVDSGFDWEAKIQLTQHWHRPLFIAMALEIGVDKTIHFFQTILEYNQFKQTNLKNILSRTILNAKGKKLKEILKMKEKKLNLGEIKYYAGSLKILEWNKKIKENLEPDLKKKYENLNKNLLEGKFDALSVMNDEKLQEKYEKLLN